MCEGVPKAGDVDNQTPNKINKIINRAKMPGANKAFGNQYRSSNTTVGDKRQKVEATFKFRTIKGTTRIKGRKGNTQKVTP